MSVAIDCSFYIFDDYPFLLSSAPKEAIQYLMRTFSLLLTFFVFTISVFGQGYSQRLSPVVSATSYEVCPNDEVQVTVVYSEPVNTSILLNGLDEFANVSATTAFDFGANTNFTIEFFMKSPAAAALQQGLVTKGDVANGAGFHIGTLAGVVNFTLSDGTNNITINGFTNVSDGAWHHVAVVVDRANTATILVDGIYDNDGAIGTIGNINSTELMRIGAGISLGTPSNFYNGNIDEVRVWDSDLTTAQIVSRSTSHINPLSVTGLIGYWDMNELAVPFLVDCSPTGATATLVSAASLSIDAPTLTWNFNPKWNTGQSGTTIFANPLDTTKYKVEIGYCKYLSADSATIRVIECEEIDETGLISSVWVPSAFTPNGDFKNDLFEVKASNITYYEIMIFNRAGNIFYHSQNILNSWDGTFEGERVKDDVYTYVITYRDRYDEQFKKYGTVTVLH